jgi:glycosyltransferase involved in cell wall biosynthesis
MQPESMADGRFRIAIAGTRGVPANYGGFETFAEELSLRLASRGHEVTVYGRTPFVSPGVTRYRGVRVRVLPCIHHKYLETVSHTAASALVGIFQKYHLVVVCNAVNAPFCALFRLGGAKVVLNVDGIERQRRKWNRLGKAAYRAGELMATLLPNRVVADARVIQQYYRDKYGFESTFISYGALLERTGSCEQLKRLGLQPNSYILYVSRLEPENNAHLVIEAYRRSGVEMPLVVVGDAPYARRYKDSLRRLAEGARVLLPGAIYGTGYRELLGHCRCYVHATEVGGTHPALIEAMGSGCVVIANDTPENREVVGGAGLHYPFNDAASLAGLLKEAATRQDAFEDLRELARKRVRECYDWERIVDQYEEMFRELVQGRRPGG